MQIPNFFPKEQKEEEETGPTKLILSKKQRFAHLLDDFTVYYPKKSRGDRSVGSVQTDKPFKTTERVGYFEVEIVEVGVEGSISIGVSEEDFKITSHVGWENDNSYGWHCDDGRKFHHSSNGERFGPTSTKGDIIGCCVDFHRQIIFFTKNGEFVDIAWTNVIGTFYPTVGLHSKGEVAKIRLKHPFKYNIQRYITIEKQKEKELIHKQLLDQNIPLNLIRSYLFIKGSFGALAKTGLIINEKDQEKVQIQQKFKTLILNGDIPQTIELLEIHFPTLIINPEIIEQYLMEKFKIKIKIKTKMKKKSLKNII
ncbi:ran-binding protein m [Anaeramoeba ignava]|uniref:Ran-binding protein m n=1 Tax=Anaeramoeba ignava TaxID=1746090 RepID=A0A9Q0L9W7_ANAIG|nr:ran-binding protein m [Anaeramoeba ignava]